MSKPSTPEGVCDLASLKAKECELQKELIDVQGSIAKTMRQRRLFTLQHVLNMKNVLLDLIDHTRVSCATYNNNSFHPQHGGVGCARCFLEQLTEYTLPGYEDVETILTLHFVKHQGDK